MKTVKEPARKITVFAQVDVVVAGGGPAGLCAAIAAARNGAKTLLIERYGHLGGMATGGHVIYIDLMSGVEKQVVYGLAEEILERAIQLGGCMYIGERAPAEERKNPYIDAEVHKYVAQELVEASGAKMLLHTWAVNSIVGEDGVQGVIIESKSGRQAILAKVVIDATGDGDIAALAGAPFEMEKRPITIINRVGGVDVERVRRFERESPEAYKRFVQELVKKGIAAGPYLPRIGYGWEQTVREGVVFCHWASFLDRDATSAEDLTYCEVEGRKKIMEALDLYRRSVPGWEKAYLLDTAPQIGTRESRRIIGDYVLTMKDIEDKRHFDDNVATCPMPKTDHVYEIPYRTLVPRKVENLLIAGRCVSCDHEAQQYTRTIAPCMAMGQAVGTAAALALERGIKPRDVFGAVSELQRLLVQQGANLGQK